MSRKVSKGAPEKSKLLVHVLICLFGITSWSIMNGLWVELPILVSHLPEGWTLPSYLTVTAQFGNLGPLTFSFLIWLFPRTKLETPTSMLVLSVLSLCALFYAFFWEQTIELAGRDVSFVLLLLTLIQSIFAATSSMCYLGFMAHLKSRYMSSIFIGQGLSGLIPAFIAIGQGTSEVRCVPNITNITGSTKVFSQDFHNNTANFHNQSIGKNSSSVSLVHINADPNFLVRSFFLVLFALGMVSLTSLLLLVYHPYCRTEHVDTDQEENCRLMQSGSHELEALTSTMTTDSKTTRDSVRSHPEDLSHADKPGKEWQQQQQNGEEPGDKRHNISENPFTITNALYDPERDSEKRIKTAPKSSRQSSIQKEGGRSQGVFRWFRNRNRNRDNNRDNNGLHKTETNGQDGDGFVEVEVAVVSKENHPVAQEEDGQGRQLTKLESWYLLGLLVWINALQTSYVLAIQVYSSLPYGLVVYDGVTKTENIVDPIACFITLYVTARTTGVISGLTLLGTLFTAYIITVAVMSPLPFLVHQTVGGILVITAWVMCTMFMVFSKVSIASVMRSQGRKSLMFTGASTQIGSLIGAVLAYCMINQLNLFHDGPWC